MHAPPKVVCDMSALPPVSLGGDGTTEDVVADNCDVVGELDGDDNGVYFIKSSSGAARQRYCEFDPMSRKASDLGGDGSVKSEASESCWALRKGFGLNAGVYWVGSKEVFCEMVEDEDQHGTSLGEDGTDEDSPAASCEGIMKHAKAGNTVAKSAVYFTTSPAGAVVETACKFDGDALVSQSYDGSSKLLAATSCELVYTYFTKDNGKYWINEEDPAEVLCVDGKVSKMGESSLDPAPSCNQLYKNIKPAPQSGNYWIKNNDWPKARQVFCDMKTCDMNNVCGGWMLVQTSHPSKDDKGYMPLANPLTNNVAKKGNQVQKDYLSLAKNSWRNNGKNSPQILWVKWEKDQIQTSYRMSAQIRFQHTYDEWIKLHRGDSGRFPFKVKAFWDVHYPNAGYKKQGIQQLVRAVQLGEGHNQNDGSNNRGLHYKRTNSGEHYPWWDKNGKKNHQGYACFRRGQCGYSTNYWDLDGPVNKWADNGRHDWVLIR